MMAKLTDHVWTLAEWSQATGRSTSVGHDPPFPRPSFTVAGAVGVFRFLSCLTGQRGVDDIYEQAVGSLSLQQPLPQDGVDIELPPPRPRYKEAADLEDSPDVEPHSVQPGRLQAGHPPGVQQERDDHPDQQELRQYPSVQPCGIHLLRPGSESATMTMVRLLAQLVRFEMIYPLRRVSPFSPIPISGKSPNRATSKRASEGSASDPALAVGRYVRFESPLHAGLQAEGPVAGVSG